MLCGRLVCPSHLLVANVEASLLFYVGKLGFTSPWQYKEDDFARVAQVEREGCALILSDNLAGEVGNGRWFVSLNLEPEQQIAAIDRLRAEFESRGVPVREMYWGYRLLVIEDPDGNQIFFNYP